MKQAQIDELMERQHKVNQLGGIPCFQDLKQFERTLEATFLMNEDKNQKIKPVYEQIFKTV